MFKLISTFALTVCLLTGCQSTPKRVAYTTTESIVLSVDAAMKVWAKYVIVQRHKHEGDVVALAELSKKEAKVRNAYEIYQKSAEAAIKAQLALVQTQGQGVFVTMEAVAEPLINLIGDLTHGN